MQIQGVVLYPVDTMDSSPFRTTLLDSTRLILSVARYLGASDTNQIASSPVTGPLEGVLKKPAAMIPFSHPWYRPDRKMTVWWRRPTKDECESAQVNRLATNLFLKNPADGITDTMIDACLRPSRGVPPANSVVFGPAVVTAFSLETRSWISLQVDWLSPPGLEVLGGAAARAPEREIQLPRLRHVPIEPSLPPLPPVLLQVQSVRRNNNIELAHSILHNTYPDCVLTQAKIALANMGNWISGEAQTQVVVAEPSPPPPPVTQTKDGWVYVEHFSGITPPPLPPPKEETVTITTTTTITATTSVEPPLLQDADPLASEPVPVVVAAAAIEEDAPKNEAGKRERVVETPQGEIDLTPRKSRRVSKRVYERVERNLRSKTKK